MSIGFAGRIGFAGLGNLGSKLAGSLLRNGIDLVVRDLDEALVSSFVERGATSAASHSEIKNTLVYQNCFLVVCRWFGRGVGMVVG